MGCYVSKQTQVVVQEIEEMDNVGLDRSHSSQSSRPIRIEVKEETSEAFGRASSKSSRSRIESESPWAEESGELTIDSLCTSLEEEVYDNTGVSRLVKEMLSQRRSQDLPPDVQRMLEERQLESNSPPTGRTKTACCGRHCQVDTSRFCCEHDSARPVARYCQVCRRRYDDWQQANQAFEEMLHELEESETMISISPSPSENHDHQGCYEEALLDSASSEEELLFPEEKCAVCLDPFSSASGSLPFFPCGHSVCCSHLGKLNGCPLCRTSADSPERTSADRPEADASSVESAPSPETQTGRYEVMHSPTKRQALTKDVLSAEVRRYLYETTRSPVVSSLSLGESETGSMRSDSF